MAKIGVIGVGGWGKNHLRVFYELGLLSAFCDFDQSRVDLYGKKYGVHGYTSVNEFLDKADIDGVTVCTPTVTHFDIAKKAMERGLHTFVEKPLTALSSEGEALIDLSIRKKVKFTVGYIERFNPAVIALKDILKSGKLGEPLLLEFHRENKWPSRIQDVGIVVDTSVHDIDTARWIFESEPKLVFARTGQVMGKHEDFAAIILGFKDPKNAFITSNWVTPKRVRQLITVCTEGVATVDFVTQNIVIDDAEGSRSPRLTWEEPLQNELKWFVECIDLNRKPIVTGQDAVNTTKIAEAALISSKSGSPIYLDL